MGNSKFYMIAPFATGVRKWIDRNAGKRKKRQSKQLLQSLVPEDVESSDVDTNNEGMRSDLDYGMPRSMRAQDDDGVKASIALKELLGIVGTVPPQRASMVNPGPPPVPQFAVKIPQPSPAPASKSTSRRASNKKEDYGGGGRALLLDVLKNGTAGPAAPTVVSGNKYGTKKILEKKKKVRVGGKESGMGKSVFLTFEFDVDRLIKEAFGIYKPITLSETMHFTATSLIVALAICLTTVDAIPRRGKKYSFQTTSHSLVDFTLVQQAENKSIARGATISSFSCPNDQRRRLVRNKGVKNYGSLGRMQRQVRTCSPNMRCVSFPYFNRQLHLSPKVR
jgi:hypothetical protein